MAYILLFLVWKKTGHFKFETLYYIYFALGPIIAKSGLEERMLTNSTVTTLSFIAIFLLTDFWVPGRTSVSDIIIRIIVSCGVVVITYLCCTKLNWNQRFEKFILQCGKYSLAIYAMHWMFLHVWTGIDIPQNELLAFIPTFAFAVIICYACFLLKQIVALSPFFDFILFGSKPRKK